MSAKPSVQEQAGSSGSDERLCLPGRTWASFVTMANTMVDEAKRVASLGGLNTPGISEHIKATRMAFSGAPSISMRRAD